MNVSPTASLPPRVLVRGVNWIGDAVMTMPAVQRLREAMPRDGHLALLVPEKTADLWRHNPHVSEIITLNRAKGELAQARQIRKKHFDLAIIFPNSLRSAMIPFLARIPRRVGYHGHSRRLLLTESFPADERFDTRPRLPASQIVKLKSKRHSTATIAPPPFRHQTLHYLELLEKIGVPSQPCAPRIVLTEEEIAATANFFPFDNRPVLAVAACAEYGPAKRWPVERFAEALRVIRLRVDCRIILCGSVNDRPYCKELAERIVSASQAPTVTVIAGKTTLRELCACLARCKTMLTNDTGPMHLAVAVGVPVVSIFGSTEPTLTGPHYPGGDTRHVVIRQQAACSPCFLRECPIDFRCMTSINAEQVAEATLQQLRAA